MTHNMKTAKQRDVSKYVSSEDMHCHVTTGHRIRRGKTVAQVGTPSVFIMGMRSPGKGNMRGSAVFDIEANP